MATSHLFWVLSNHFLDLALLMGCPLRQYHIWDTVNTYLKSDVDYSPVSPGNYKWPLDSATGFYKNIYAGPLPPLECEDPIPEGYVLVGCYEDSSKNRLFSKGPITYVEKGDNGLTPSVRTRRTGQRDL